ncbi:MAG: hypothetical protein EPN60_17275 [Nevskiaceae bacterium]|nr:MAG: hypothetical protein EPO48_11110 [Nevskiaceae bacterium]TAM22264.1 MAG: hypothetical protein EPN60_17275 [Nevskiaceae bacterium]
MAWAASFSVLMVAAVVVQHRLPFTQALSPAACPEGYVAQDPLEVSRELNPAYARDHAASIRQQFGNSICVSPKLPESLFEIGATRRDKAQVAGRPLQGLRRAIEQKEAMQAAQAKLANAAGEWADYGQGPQVSDPAYPAGNTDGIPEVAGRVDNFAYDPEHKRLFAAVGNGGIWMSEAVDGDLGTLGDLWRPVGDKLPSLVNSAVAWTPVEGGRLIVLTGEHTMGGNSYVGLGVYWSDDLGESWNHASGVPDEALAFKLAVDGSNPSIVYAATGKGLFRSEDAGESFVNVKLPVSADCAGVETLGPCQFASFVTDVVVKAPGGSINFECGAEGCPVLAAVGFRAGAIPYADGTLQAPGNGLYRSDSGLPDSFSLLSAESPSGLLPFGFAQPERVGRVELGAAIGPEQDHDYVYAIVEDAVLFNGGFPLLDIDVGQDFDPAMLCAITGPLSPICDLVVGGVASATTFNGLYVSSDFGSSWTRLLDDVGLYTNAVPAGSSLATTIALGVGPGVQSWYDMWVKPDPTAAQAGAPTRVTFGLEELWVNRLPLPPVGLIENTPIGWNVFGAYFAGDTCLFLIGNLGLGESAPICPGYDGLINGTTTHPDQHDGIYIPDEDGGVWLFVGNDGGVYRQHSSSATDNFRNDNWGRGVNQGFYTLMNYGIAVANDGTVYYGLQDNTSGKIEPESRRQVRVYIGDGMWAAVHPDNSQIAYYQTPGLALVRTLDGGASYSYIDSFDVGTAHFLSPFVMDPKDPEHLVAAGTKVAETSNASTDASWTTVFELGVDEVSGAAHITRQRPLAVSGDNIYVGFCGPCNLAGSDTQFQRGIATNVGGDKPAQRGTGDGWHFAKAEGLPNRYIYEIAIDPDNPKTIWVVLGGYSTARWAPPGQYLDENAALGEGSVYKSTDAGETFTNVSGNLPDLIVTAILKRRNQLIIGTDIGTFISSDLDGKEWAPLGDLPAVPVNQLVLKPDDDTQLFAATFGRGVQHYVMTDQPDGGSSSGGSSSGASSSGGSSSGGSSGGSSDGHFGGSAGLGLLSLLALAAAWRRRFSRGGWGRLASRA